MKAMVGIHGNAKRRHDDPERQYDDWKYDLSRQMFSARRSTQRDTAQREHAQRPRLTPEERRLRQRNKNQRRRARNRYSDLTSTDIRLLLASRTYCPLCRRRMTDDAGPHQKNLDHIVPNILGGTWTRGNVRVICAKCNMGRPTDGSDLLGYQPTLWAQDLSAAQAIALDRQKEQKAKRQAQHQRRETIKHAQRTAKKLSDKIRADLAYYLRINGHRWETIAETCRYKGTGAAYNAVHGNPAASYAPREFSFLCESQ